MQVIALHADRTRGASQEMFVPLPDGTSTLERRIATVGYWTATPDEICFIYPESLSTKWTDWPGHFIRSPLFKHELRMSLEILDENRIQLEGVALVRVPDDAPWPPSACAPDTPSVPETHKSVTE